MQVLTPLGADTASACHYNCTTEPRGLVRTYDWIRARRLEGVKKKWFESASRNIRMAFALVGCEHNENNRNSRVSDIHFSLSRLRRRRYAGISSRWGGHDSPRHPPSDT